MGFIFACYWYSLIIDFMMNISKVGNVLPIYLKQILVYVATPFISMYNYPYIFIMRSVLYTYKIAYFLEINQQETIKKC